MQLVMPFALPPGFRYAAELIDSDEERALLADIEGLAFTDVRMHGIVARRRTAHFGYDYRYDSARVSPGTPLPDFLLRLRRRCAALARVPPEDLVEGLVSEYPPGAAIGWHRDAPSFGDVVVGVSLLSPCRMKLRPGGSGPAQVTLELAPRSAYVLSGSARSVWQHHIPPVRSTRYSVTFRTLASS